jgi:hydroxymethylbilane synthase
LRESSFPVSRTTQSYSASGGDVIIAGLSKERGRSEMKEKVRIGTRGSKLALWQAEWVAARLRELSPALVVELVKIKTTGDKILDVPLAKVGGKGLFVKEIEEALLRGDVDLAVHSMKDVPTELPPELHIGAVLTREDPRDALISNGVPFNALPQGATVGTSSLRRSCQLLHARGDLKVTSLRGNLDTRLRKLEEGQFDAIILAAAGVKRLGFEDRITEVLSVDISLPAIAQGAVGIECRREDKGMNGLIRPLDHPETSTCVGAERAALKRLEGGCQVPIAAHAVLMDGRVVMDGLVGSVSGDRIIREHIEGLEGEAEALGTELAERLLSQGAAEILAEVYGAR